MPGRSAPRNSGRSTDATQAPAVELSDQRLGTAGASKLAQGTRGAAVEAFGSSGRLVDAASTSGTETGPEASVSGRSSRRGAERSAHHRAASHTVQTALAVRGPAPQAGTPHTASPGRPHPPPWVPTH
jgi:hypothetical protein